MKKIIYIGETAGYTVYFDRKRKQILKSKKSQWLSNKKTRNNSKVIILILIAIILGGSVLTFFGKDQFFTGEYTIGMLFFLILFWIFEFSFLATLTHRILYKDIKNAEKATKKEFRNAVQNNNIWNIFNNKKVTITKKIFAWILTLLFLSMTMGFFFILFKINEQGSFLGSPIGSELIPLSLFGILPYIAFYLVWQNNLIGWFNVVGSYQKRKLEERKNE
ncbi:hypothetical protein [Listeria valentina]|uniref:hypothetical protein n=1 Tax=Listeria valentina TaxID=2705293 RepID=UPI001430B0BA|nr:hypothetical protein [Listeria valentina]